MSENIDEKGDFPILATAKKDVCIDDKERQLCHFLEEESPNFENIRKIISNDVDLKNSISLIVLSSNESLHNQQDFLETFQSLISHGVNINKQDNHGRNVLHILCQNYGKKNLPSIIRLLIEEKMEINTTDENGENAIFYLCQNQNKFLRVKVLKTLTRHGIQFCHDRCAKKCFRLLKGICAEPIIESLKIWKTRNSMPGWHLNCTDCVNILSIPTKQRQGFQHHQMCGNTYSSFSMVLEDLRKRALKQKEATVTEISQHEKTKWIQENDAILKTLIGISDYEILLKISVQLHPVADSSRFDCDSYEQYLRCLYRISKKTGTMRTMDQIEWFFLLPFDERKCYLKDEEQEMAEAKMTKWDQTLFNILHTKGNDCLGEVLADIATTCGSSPYFHKCHGQQ